MVVVTKSAFLLLMKEKEKRTTVQDIVPSLNKVQKYKVWKISLNLNDYSCFDSDLFILYRPFNFSSEKW